jgi:hypothetical protein
MAGKTKKFWLWLFTLRCRTVCLMRGHITTHDHAPLDNCLRCGKNLVLFRSLEEIKKKVIVAEQPKTWEDIILEDVARLRAVVDRVEIQQQQMAGSLQRLQAKVKNIEDFLQPKD